MSTAILPAPGELITVTEPGSAYLLRDGEAFGRILSRPTVPFTVNRTGDGSMPVISHAPQTLDLNEGDGGILIRGVRFVGDDYERHLGAVIMNSVAGVTFEDCIFEGSLAGLTASRQDGTVAGPSRVRLSGCTIRFCGAVGAFFNSVNGLLVENSVIDDNGWGDRAVTNRPPNQCHGIYPIGCQNAIFRNCLFSRNRMNGLRGCGQVVENCIFLDNACGIAAGSDAIAIRNNLIMWGRDFDPANGGTWGVGIDLNDGFNTTVEGNIIAHNRGTGNVAAISVHGRYSGVKLVRNTVVGWDISPGEGTAYNLGGDGYGANYRSHGLTCQTRGGVELHGAGKDDWNHAYNREVAPEQLVDAGADPIKWCDTVLGRPGLSVAQAVEAVVNECERDWHAIGRIMQWHKDRLKTRS